MRELLNVQVCDATEAHSSRKDGCKQVFLRMINEAATAIQQQWGLQLPDMVTVEELLDRLAQRIAQLLAGDPDAFFQLMYKLDIPERKLNVALHGEDPAYQVGQLIYQRQLQKIQSRLEHGSGKAEDVELEW